MRFIALALICLTSLALGTLGQGRLGRRVEDVTPRQANNFNQGAGLFGFPWVADPGLNLFNARACDTCHRVPSWGGTTRDPERMVRMVPSSTEPSGWVNYPMNQELGGVVTRRPEPAGRELRRPMALYGLGFLEAVPEATIAKFADPGDKNKDGISGRSLRVSGGIGRFGWKANVPSIQSFVHGAFEAELGVTVFKEGMDNAQMDENQVRQVATFVRLLSAPLPTKDLVGTMGEKLFISTGCAKCHVPEMKTGDSDVAGLAKKSIRAYTDLLLHDIGPGKPTLDQGKVVSRREFRTAPLWGVGRIGGPYWHDASAPTLEDAIEKHEGEALAARDHFRSLSKDDRSALLEFISSL